jgi:hypothetical protein
MKSVFFADVIDNGKNGNSLRSQKIKRNVIIIVNLCVSVHMIDKEE